MINLVNTLKLLFLNIPPAEIIDGGVCYDDFGKESFKSLMSPYLENSTHLETEYLYEVFGNQIRDQDERLFKRFSDQLKERNLNVFELLLVFADQVLLELDGEPLCKYQQLQWWRKAGHLLGEEVLISAFLAYRDIYRQAGIRDLQWRLVIRSNNRGLQKILQRGIAENHFHLKGSAPYFHLSWISLMNHVNRVEFRRKLERYEKYRLSRNYRHNSYYPEEKLYVMQRQAALIRLLLFFKLNGRPLGLAPVMISTETLKTRMSIGHLDDVSVDMKELVKLRNDALNLYERVWMREILQVMEPDKRKALPEWFCAVIGAFLFDDVFFDRNIDRPVTAKQIFLHVLDQNRMIPAELCYRYGLIGKTDYDDLGELFHLNLIKQLLKDEQLMEQYINAIQAQIETVKNNRLMNFNSKIPDYALDGSMDSSYNDSAANHVLVGERWICYEMFKWIYSGSTTMSPYIQLFYAYIVLKENIRAELIQVNSKVGFDNFSMYESRKEDFIEHTELEPYFLKLAVRDTMRSEPIHALEARITPRLSAVDNRDYIKKQDKLTGLNHAEMDRMFYVFHFVKAPCKARELSSDVLCRHSSLRKKIKCQALAIAQLRRNYPGEAQRILGIDACNEEITCRPEVFSQAFRFLRNHTRLNDEIHHKKFEKVVSLGITYHAGEDFLDVTDGLRAIEEAWHLLNMKCGDRIGHALALGIDVQEWYQCKNWKIEITQQAYLDNLVWLYVNIRKLGIGSFEKLLVYLEQEYNRCFQIVYRDYISEESIRDAHKKERIYWESCGKRGVQPGVAYPFDIMTYYEAWKLRGDDPACYIDGFFRPPVLLDYSWERFAVNEEYPRNYGIRRNFEAAYLYHLYHYNTNVKRMGEKKIQADISQVMCNAVKLVQKNLQNKIAETGIGVEANPSSNYLISTFKRYDKHPMLNLNSEGLIDNNGVQKETAEISISINTDDQGVFATSLENEYTLMAAALEGKRDEKGDPVYSRSAIYNWLDHVRIMGLDQSFYQGNLNSPPKSEGERHE